MCVSVTMCWIPDLDVSASQHWVLLGCVGVTGNAQYPRNEATLCRFLPFPARKGALTAQTRCEAGGNGEGLLLTRWLCFSLQVVVLLEILSWGQLEDD